MAAGEPAVDGVIVKIETPMKSTSLKPCHHGRHIKTAPRKDRHRITVDPQDRHIGSENGATDMVHVTAPTTEAARENFFIERAPICHLECAFPLSARHGIRLL